MRFAIALFFALTSSSLLAEAPYLVRDINTTLSLDYESSYPNSFTSYRGRIFFTAQTKASGDELWSSDGTDANTSMVRDIVPGVAGASVYSLQVVNDRLTFSARTLESGSELWVTDGTKDGTRILKDIKPGTGSSQPGSHGLLGKQMLFAADDGVSGTELWVTDATTEGTRLLADLRPGSVGSSPAYFRTLDTTTYFGAALALWKTDGTTAGTVKVVDVAVRDLRVVGSQLYFKGYTAAANWELWVSDGTAAGTRMVTEINPGANAAFEFSSGWADFAVFNNGVLFEADDGVHGPSLWFSDGTTAGTRLVADIIPGSQAAANWEITDITVLGQRAFFSAGDATHGRELWVSDGTEGGTTLFADLTPGSESSGPWFLTAAGGRLFFTAGQGSSIGTPIWVTDGTQAGTRKLGGEAGPHAGNGIASGFWPVDGSVCFLGATSNTGSEPWMSDGTDAGTRMMANVSPDRAPSSSPQLLTATDNLLFFYCREGTIAPSGMAEYSLWRTDGSEAGTFKLEESGQHTKELIPAGPLVFFGSSLSDGSLQGTKSAAEFNQRFGGSKVNGYYPLGDTIYATVGGSRFESKLWKTTAASDAPAILLGSTGPNGFTPVADQLYFWAESATSFDPALWTTDGTPDGTFAVIPELTDESTSALTNVAGTLFFVRQKRGEASKLWKSDGTLDGTVPVKQLPATPTGYFTMCAAGHRLVFVLGDALWVSDGTEAGTFELAKVTLFPGDHDVLRGVGDRVVFPVYVNPGSGGNAEFDLWSSDGTTEGTMRLRSMDQFNRKLSSVDGVVYFAASDDDHGAELWTTDGTSAGTKLLVDVNPGPASSHPDEFVKLKDLLCFTAYTETSGYELWALPLTEPRVSIDDVKTIEGDGAGSTARFTVSLSGNATQKVSVRYATTDGTARAGEDYEARSGTLTFATGEWAKTIDVPIRGDVLPEDHEKFFMGLSNPAGARIITPEGVAVIQDDDQFSDLKTTLSFTGDGYDLRDLVTVSNLGPRAATDVKVLITSTPEHHPSGCPHCRIPQIAVGATADTPVDYWSTTQEVYLTATASARQRDRDTSNNSVAWTLNSNRTMSMNALYLTPGQVARVTVFAREANPVVTSSDPSVLEAPSSLTAEAGSVGTFDIRGLKSGVSKLSVSSGGAPLPVMVVEPGVAVRWPNGVAMGSSNTATHFESPVTFTITPTGTAPYTGATATGVVTVTAQGEELARGQLNDSEPLKLSVYFGSIGLIPYTVSYAGDSNFLPQTRSDTITIGKGLPSLICVLDRTGGADGVYLLRIRAEGSPRSAPTGTLIVQSGQTEVARLTLSPSIEGASVAQKTISGLGDAPTLTVRYSGDAYYYDGSQQVRAAAPRRRPSRR